MDGPSSTTRVGHPVATAFPLQAFEWAWRVLTNVKWLARGGDPADDDRPQPRNPHRHDKHDDKQHLLGTGKPEHVRKLLGRLLSAPLFLFVTEDIIHSLADGVHRIAGNLLLAAAPAQRPPPGHQLHVGVSRREPAKAPAT